MTHAHTSYWQTFEQFYIRGILIFVISVLVTVSIGFVLPVRYTSTSQLLIIQRQSSVIDAYTAYRAADRSGRNLVQVANSSSFRQRVFDRLPASSAAEYTKLSEEQKAKVWAQQVDIKLIPDSTILRISVTTPTDTLALQLNSAVNAVLTSQYADYLGSDFGTVITEIDSPTVGANPSQPDFFVLGLIGGVIGFLATAIYFWTLSRKINQE